MAPLAAMLFSLILFRTLGWAGWDYMNDWVISLRFAVAIMFLVAASAHWGRLRGDLIAMMPPRIPNAQILISLTGILEIAGAIMLLIPATAMAASTGLALMLLAMFPANIYAAQKKLTLGGKPVTPIGARTIMQMLFLAAALAAGWLPPQG
ncbi:DoxX family protein [Paenibacillus glucanolyticus]|uniref:DoxX family protein n=1 Tax=Paenibacillus glucanolyticus TaxID=59843 RepID=UPI00128BAE17|nr:hypothetical protein [Paenibacillus glucanolyticus]MPY17147.1 hypothetical protein [Paenibacillus glucanolyticus]